MAKLFYLKWHIEEGVLILDQQRYNSKKNEFLITPYKVTQSQAKRLKKRITNRFLYKERKPFLNEIEFEFYNIFHVCKRCGFVTDKAKVNKAWGELCNSCFRDYQEEKKIEYQKSKDYRKRIRQLKVYLQTEQGKVDAVPNEVIQSNVRLEVIKANKTMKDVANYLGISESAMSLFFDNKRIDAGQLQAICEYLMVPIERMTRMPRGVRIKRKDGVPAHWLKEGFRIKS